MPPDAQLAGFTLRTNDLESMTAWYEGALGFSSTRTDEGARLSLDGGLVTIDLLNDPSAPSRPYPCVGLYHFALLLPNRPALGGILEHLIERETGFEGFADHGVSEAIYLRDPDYNGIELYRDRPKGDWPKQADGTLAMVSDPLDTRGIANDSNGTGGLDPETRLGHVHMHVADIADGETFYKDTLGLNLIQRMFPSASFLAAGDYHHHVGINIWAGTRIAPANATGMTQYRWRINEVSMRELATQTGSAGDSEEITLTDPAGVNVVIGYK